MRAVSSRTSLLFGAVTLAAIAGARLFDAAHLSLRPCPFLSLTGQPCPTCFGTRALSALGNGDLIGALVMQPLVTLVVLVVMVWSLLTFISPLFARTLSPARLSPAARIITGWTAAILFIANWAFLILKN